MPEESKLTDEPVATKAKVDEVPHDDVEGDEDGEEEEAESQPADANGEASTSAPKKKKKSKRKKIKDALTGGASGISIGGSDKKLTHEQLQLLLESNPALKAEAADMSPQQLEALMGKLSMSDLLTGIAPGGKNQKDMASYKFWQTQPVPAFEERQKKEEQLEDGEIKAVDISRVPKEPGPLVEGFEWVTMDLEDAKELEEVYDLLTNHYVEDAEAMFRFKYSASFLHWYATCEKPGCSR